MPRTLYLTRNGLLEPLGQSQVMAYLRGLAKDHKITLITYEKDEDRADAARMARAREECVALGIRWLPQRFRPQPKIIAPAFSMLRMVWLTRREVRRGDVRLIHARSYIPAAVAWVVGRLTGVPFIFDMRALWPEELITAGRLRRGSLIHRAIVEAERACLRDAAAVVSLTHTAVDHLRTAYVTELADQRIAVIPTCADLERFVPAVTAPKSMVIGCLGTVLSGWFRIDWLSAFLRVAAGKSPDARFDITTRDNPMGVQETLGLDPVVADRVFIVPATPEEVPAILQRQTASVMFFTDGLAKLGSSPTRMGEILGCGIPVVANDGVGDVARIIRNYNVGVLAEDGGPAAMAEAWDALMQLLEDPELSARCRCAAEEVFSLESGIAAYRRLYRDILSKTDEPTLCAD
ncbi:MAG TPA: glycosyltransferase [Gammaproteobacteria bacterium]|nr:glycosyltransferase [Gammaproteobacteria bacterium]